MYIYWSVVQEFHTLNVSARGRTVIVTVNGREDQSSNPGRDLLRFTSSSFTG